MATAVAAKGLEGIVAANSGIAAIDGDAGSLPTAASTFTTSLHTQL